MGALGGAMIFMRKIPSDKILYGRLSLFSGSFSFVFELRKTICRNGRIKWDIWKNFFHENWYSTLQIPKIRDIML